MRPAAKRRANVTISGDLLDDAKAHGLNVSAISEAALAETVRRARAEAWARENAAAIEARARWIEENGAPLERWQVSTPE